MKIKNKQRNSFDGRGGEGGGAERLQQQGSAGHGLGGAGHISSHAVLQLLNAGVT